MPPFDRSYYLTAYRDYARQNPRRKQAYYLRLMERWVPENDNGRLLEIGCGPGAFLEYAVARRQGMLIGCDLCAEIIKDNQKRISDTHFLVADAQHLSFRPAAFSVVTAFDALEHLPALDAAARSIAGALESKGVFIFVVPVYDGPCGSVIRRLDRDPTHLHKQSRAFWLTWAAKYFHILDCIGIFRYLLPGGHYAHFAGRWMKSFAPAILVVCAARR